MFIILDIEEYLSEKDWEHKLFSMQYCGQLLMKVVRIDGVVQKLIDSETISEAERKSLRAKKVADQKFRHLLTIITEYCNINDLQAYKTFIDILGDTNNVDIAQPLSLIYNERVRSSNLISKFRVKTDLIYKNVYIFILLAKLHGKEINIKNTNIFTIVSERK
jgi:ribosome-binding factor A